MKSTNRPKINVSDPDKLNLTEAEWKELEFTGCVIKGDRIIRTLAFMNRSEKGAREHIAQTARRVFA